MFHNIRTAGNKAIQYSAVILISPDVLNAMELTSPNITERKCNVAWTIRKQIDWPLRKASPILMSLNV